MVQFISDVDQRTRLAGQNRMELLLFYLGTPQLFGINVFKVREVIAKPTLSHLPGSSPLVCGIATIRGRTVSVIDLARAIGFAPMPVDQNNDAKVIVAEFNRAVQGFWVSAVERIVDVNWEQVKPPPRGTDRESYLVAVTEVNGQLVEIIDVERVFAQINHLDTHVAPEVQAEAKVIPHDRRILVVDDSLVARKKIERTIAELGFRTESRSDGKAALDYLEELAAADMVDQSIELIISDIEMPRMDGYTLSRKIREHPKLKHLRIILHSSLSGQFNVDMVRRVGADDFLAKFDPTELGMAVLKYARHDTR
ncbi:chemotaxis protein CheV [Caldichromatium japonicum]|uniref:Chemotaxis protein CheV n=1 Tax=Caldichromatium japonicum TaxID=2699430 RepID=A0A6G7VD32_9GAMM|nr:chemotaxis protein [Caldichromatium japonicum]QIK37983.1 chemotaxis protein CheV [Caldichromatium japonicum]